MINNNWFEGLTSRRLGDGLVWKNEILPSLVSTSASLPELFTAIENLTKLNCSKANLKSLCGLEYSFNLGKLNCSSNYLEDFISLRRCTELKYLDASNNKIKTIDDIENLPIEELYLSFNNLKFIDFSNWKFPRRLKILHIDNNKLQYVRGLDRLKNLVELNLSNNLLTEVSHYEFLPSLIDLDLSNNPDLKGKLNKVEGFKYIDIRNTKINEIKPRLSREEEELLFMIEQMRSRKNLMNVEGCNY